MKATLEFNLPEEQHEFQLAANASKMASAICELDTHIRAWLKHGHDYVSVDTVLSDIRLQLRDIMPIAMGEE